MKGVAMPSSGCLKGGDVEEEKFLDGTKGNHVEEELHDSPLEYIRNDPVVKKYQSKGPRRYSGKRPVINLFSFHHTALKMVLSGVDFYILMILHISLSITFQKAGKVKGDPVGRTGLPPAKWYKINNEMLAVLTPLVIFVLVFYNNRAYGRYMEQFFAARKVDGRIKFIANRLRSYFRNDPEPFPGAEQTMREILRTIVVGHYCLYLCLPRYKRRKIDVWGWDYLKKYNLVTEEEHKQLYDKNGNQVMAEAHAFVMERLGQHVQRGDIDTITYQAFEDDMHDMIFFIMMINAYAENPVPFAYYHLANLLAIGELVLIAYSLVFLNSYLTIAVYALLCIAVLGLRDLSCALADPFGVDDTDFQTLVPTAIVHMANEDIIGRDSVFGSAKISFRPRDRRPRAGRPSRSGREEPAADAYGF